jgi:phage gp36-like protein
MFDRGLKYKTFYFMSFITTDDYKATIKDGNLSRMIEGDNTVLEEAQATAVAVIRDALFSRYDVNVVFGAQGDSRNKQVVRWAVVLTLYYLYERLPANIMPERVRDNYTEVMGFLKEIEDGKKPIDLPQKTNSETGEVVTKFRYGINPPRTHNY